jgi:hypothetical protein
LRSWSRSEISAAARWATGWSGCFATISSSLASARSRTSCETVLIVFEPPPTRPSTARPVAGFFPFAMRPRIVLRPRVSICVCSAVYGFTSGANFCRISL